MTSIKFDTFENRIREVRKQILEIVEASYADTRQFNLVRRRILFLFGRDGLEGAYQRLNAKPKPQFSRAVVAPKPDAFDWQE